MCTTVLGYGSTVVNSRPGQHPPFQRDLLLSQLQSYYREYRTSGKA